MGLQPGEIIAVLDYLEKRSRAVHTTSYSHPPTPNIPPSPYHIGVPTSHIPHYPSSGGTHTSPCHFTYPKDLTVSPTAATHPPPQQYTSNPSTPQQYTSNPSTPTIAPHHPPPQLYTSTPPAAPCPPPQLYTSTPPTPAPAQHSLYPSNSTSLPQFTPSYPASTRLPTPALAYPHSLDGPGANHLDKKYGFGQFSCVLCRSQDHTTDRCPDRDHLFFRSSQIQ